MKYLKWLVRNHFELVMAILAAVALVVGIIVAAIFCDSLDKQNEKAVAAGVFAVCNAEETMPEIEEATVTVEETRSYFDVPLSTDVQDHIFKVSEYYGIDPSIIVAMCYRESTYKADKIGDNGNSYGLMQIQPRWHYQRMADLGCTDLLDPCQNITVGVDYLDELMERYGSIDKALTAYNRGSYSGTVTQYAKAVMETAQSY